MPLRVLRVQCMYVAWTQQLFRFHVLPLQYHSQNLKNVCADQTESEAPRKELFLSHSHDGFGTMSPTTPSQCEDEEEAG